MNEKGRQTKLLAAIAAIAMIVCAVAVFLPSDVNGEVTATADNNANPIMSVQIGDATTSYYAVDTGAGNNDINDAISAINNASSSVQVTILQDFTLDISAATNNEAGLWFSNSNNIAITINGGDHTITAKNTATDDDNRNVIGFTGAATYAVSNLNIDGADAAHHGINFYNLTSTGNTFTSVDVTACTAAGMCVNGSNVSVVTSDLSENVWGDINVDNGSTFTIDATSNLTSNFQIWSEDKNATEGSCTINTPEGAYLECRWDRTGTDAVTNGSAYFKASEGGATVGNLTVDTNNTITVPADKTLTISGTLVLLGSISGNYDTGSQSVVQGVSDADDINAALANDDVAEMIYTGSKPLVQGGQTLTLTKPLTVTDITTVNNVTLAQGGSIAVSPADGSSINVSSPVTVNGGNGTVTLPSGFTADVIEFYYGSAGVRVEGVSGIHNITVTDNGRIYGSLDAGAKVSIVVDSATPGATATVTVDTEGLVLGQGATLTVEANVTLNAGSNITLAKGATSAELVNNGTLVYSSIPNSIKVTNNGTLRIEGGQGTENIISVSQSVNGTYYLTADTTILEGVTLTVPRNAVLNLMGYDLIVEGTLVVENRGTVTSGVGDVTNATAGNIVLTTTGSIQNEGTIGDRMTINIANGESYDEATQDYTEKVSMQGVTGVSFELVRSIDTDNNTRVYDMAVSGDVSAVRGVENPELTLKNVDINKSMTVGRDITLKIDGITDVTGNGTVFTFDGELMTITGNGFTLYDNGTSAVINGHVIGKINAKVGVMNDQGVLIDSVNEPAASVTFKDNNEFYMVGMTISVQKVTVPQDEGDAKIFQRMFVNGELKITNDDKKDNPAGMIDFAGKVYITEALAIPDNTIVGGDYTLMVSEGGVVTAIADKDPALRYNGAMYEVDGEKTTDPSTFYYTTFAGAMENIATALDGIVYVNGAFTISGTYTIADNQEIDIQNKDAIADKVIVGEGSAITVELGGIVDDLAFYQILGKVIVAEGDGYAPDATYPGSSPVQYIYAVMTEDSETYDVTYSGFKTAMDEAQAGQTITVVGNAEYDGDLVIPNGVTVQVNENLTLTVTGDVTIENGGKLVLDASTLAVGEITENGTTYTASENVITVAGELDASEAGTISAVTGHSQTADVDVYSTGKLTSMTVVGGNGVTMNAAYYNDGGEYVYTSLANAVAYAEENALPYAVHVTGTFTETGAVESDGVDIEVDSLANVTLGDLRLNDAKIALADNADKTKTWYTATVTALNGAGDAAVDSTVAVTKTIATVESKVTLNAEGTSQYALQIDNLANANVQAGTVTYVGGDFTVYKDKSLTISSGATLLIGKAVTMTNGADAMVNNGTVSIAEKVTFGVKGTLAGDVNVPKNAALEAKDGIIITGTVTVDADGKFTVTGELQIGASPELLTDTASGAIIGKVTIGADSTDYVLAFAGADLSQADIVQNGNDAAELKSTAYQINGIDFATVYAFGSVGLSTINGDVKALEDLQTKEIVKGIETNNDIEIVWYADGVAVDSSDSGKNLSADVGEYAQVTTEIRYKTVDVTVSAGPQITISVDGVVWNGYDTLPLTIGTHTVSAVVNPGYTGTVQITFNGQAVTNGQFEITSDMLNSLDPIVLSATGNVTQDSTTVITGGDSGSGDMGLTDYLLIILVILIVIMAIIVALRLMRS